MLTATAVLTVNSRFEPEQTTDYADFLGQHSRNQNFFTAKERKERKGRKKLSRERCRYAFEFPCSSERERADSG